MALESREFPWKIVGKFPFQENIGKGLFSMLTKKEIIRHLSSERRRF